MICLKVLISEIFVSSLQHEAGCEPLFSMSSITPNKKNIEELLKVYSQIRRSFLDKSLLQQGTKRFLTVTFSVWLHANCHLSHSGRNLFYPCSTGIKGIIRQVNATFPF